MNGIGAPRDVIDQDHSRTVRCPREETVGGNGAPRDVIQDHCRTVRY